MIKFDSINHKYYNENGKELISVTTLMSKYGLSPDYSKVNKQVLQSKAERGSMIHKEIEMFNKDGEIGFTNEFIAYKNYLDQNGVSAKKSEFLVHNDCVAGTVDLLLLTNNNESIIADIKTTATLHKDAVRWQLSIYAYLLNKEGYNITLKKGQAFHFGKDGELKVTTFDLLPKEEIEKLMEAVRNDETNFTPNLIELDTKKLQELKKFEQTITTYENLKVKAQEEEKKLREEILKEMEKAGVKCFENDYLKLTYVDPQTRSVIDGIRLRAEQPEIAKKYSKQSEVKASLRITLKNKKYNKK